MPSSTIRPCGWICSWPTIRHPTSTSPIRSNGQVIRSFVERGVELGIAMNAVGMSQASMGLTLGDANGDQLLDVYLGTFYHDSNTLFLQNAASTFSDETRTAGLREPTFKMLTFGTQFLDADLDGWPDIIQANGHVDRSYDPTVPDLLPPQYFKNLGNGHFVELTGDSLGPYFQQDYLGRTVAVVDFDRDGRPDVCISHLDVPVALLANRTQNAGHYLAVKLSGRTCSRDAFGATIQLTAGGRTWTQPLTAGGGYMATNERKLIFGLGRCQIGSTGWKSAGHPARPRHSRTWQSIRNCSWSKGCRS